jgi:hypothetical protein
MATATRVVTARSTAVSVWARCGAVKRPAQSSGITRSRRAYLAMMAPRLVELRRVMKRTAAICLRCDPTASHYLKMLLDAVFGEPQRAYAVHCG